MGPRTGVDGVLVVMLLVVMLLVVLVMVVVVMVLVVMVLVVVVIVLVMVLVGKEDSVFADLPSYLADTYQGV